METKTRRPVKATKAKKELKKDITATYNEYKDFEGQQYTGMKVGRKHKWHYDKGVWEEKKITPDKWEFTFAVTKRRKGHAPEGSGVPVGTQYHWYILAHQNATKLDANSYTTSMTGLKYKVAHKRADKDKWNISERTQRNHLIAILKEVIEELKKEPEEEKTAVDDAKTVKTKTEKKPVKRKTVALDE